MKVNLNNRNLFLISNIPHATYAERMHENKHYMETAQLSIQGLNMPNA